MSTFNMAEYLDHMNIAHLVARNNTPLNVPCAPCVVDRCVGVCVDMRYIPRALYRTREAFNETPPE